MPIALAGGFHTLPASDILVPTGDYSAVDPGPIEFPTLGANSVTLLTDVTAQSGAGNTLTVNVEGFDPASGKWVMLGQDAYTANAARSYPLAIDPDGPPMITRQSVSNPGAGADFIFNVPTLEVWQLYAVSYQLVAAAVAVNRLLGLMLRNSSATEQATIIGTTAVTTGQTAIANFMSGYSGQPVSQALASATVRQQMGLPIVPGGIPSGWSIRSLVDNIQGADQVSAVNLTIGRQIRELYPRMRVRPVGSGTRTTLNYSIGATLSF